MHATQQDYTVDSLAIFLSVSRPTIYKMINDGRLHAYKVGRATRVTVESVEHLRKGDV